MGIHVARPNSQAIMEFVRAAQPAVVKGVDDLGFLAEVKVVSPQTVTIGRFSVNPQDYNGEPEAGPPPWSPAQLPQMLHAPGGRLLGRLERARSQPRPDGLVRPVRGRARAATGPTRAARGRGRLLDRRAGAGSSLRCSCRPSRPRKAHGGILTLHEYAAPDLTFLYGDPLPGYPTYPDRGSLMFRYRWFYRDVLEPRGLVVPLVISEAGIDGIIGNRPGPDGLGWQDFQTFWVAQGWGPDGQTAVSEPVAVGGQ